MKWAGVKWAGKERRASQTFPYEEITGCLRYSSVDAQWFVPIGYVVSVALKVLLPPHSNNKFIQLLEAECGLFEHMVPCPQIQQAPIVLNPSRISAIDEMRMKPSPAAPPPAPVSLPAVPVEFFG